LQKRKRQSHFSRAALCGKACFYSNFGESILAVLRATPLNQRPDAA